MKYLTAAEIAKKWNLSETAVIKRCVNGSVPNSFLMKKTWYIPDSTVDFVCSGRKTADRTFWEVEEKPILRPSNGRNFDSISVKDLSIVFYCGMYHLFFTAGGFMPNQTNTEYTMGYASASTLNGLTAAKRYRLKNLQISPEKTYYCAPQIFYYRPHGLWYLVYQVRVDEGQQGSYYAAYSTNKNICSIESWTAPKALLPRSADPYNTNKWIDFWVISDEKQVYLYYKTSLGMVYRTTSFSEFPNEWSEEQLTLVPDAHEAAHLYKSREDQQYYMIVEKHDGTNGRAYMLATSDRLDSQNWRILDPLWADYSNMSKVCWTVMASHGELLRSGFDSKCEIDSIRNAIFLIQGVNRGAKGYDQSYSRIPWSIGAMRNGSFFKTAKYENTEQSVNE